MSDSIRAGAGSGAKADHKLLLVDGRRFWIKGVSYGSFRPNSAGEPFPEIGRVREDFARMRENGFNVVRLYDAPSERIADAAWECGLRLMVDVCWGPRGRELREPETLAMMVEYTRRNVRALAGHPAMFLYSLGNEIPPLTVRWYGRHHIAKFVRMLYDNVKEIAPGALVTYVNHPPTEHLDALLDFLDVAAYNVYFEDNEAFRKYLARLQLLAGDRPLMLAELGLDSSRNGPEAQARFFQEYLPVVFDRGLCGAVVYSWTDEWSIHGEAIVGWSFGLTRADRTPKSALSAVKSLFEVLPGFLPGERIPRISVVVCTYNGSATLADCLRSLTRLVYPDYEVIVVDDGSTDTTPEIASRFPVRYHRQPTNGGLSLARNVGLAMATGEIVAYIDDDAEADPHWLYFIAASLKRTAVAVGGPNFAHPKDGFVAQCVDQSPGNPVHVLLNDELAEHIPGCNMAYKKPALESIGGFDPTHHVAGDDVDVCWKLLTREQRIVYSPSAMVYHRRRPTVRAFLRQQKNYGFAEGHLVDRHPGRFNMLGYGAWQGRIYGAGSGDWLSEKLRFLVSPKIYHGRFAGARFQSVYHAFGDNMLAFATIIEWQLLALSLLAAAALGLGMGGGPLPWVLLLAGTATGALTLLAVLLAGLNAVRVKKWRGRRARWKGFCITAFLHLAQPVVRGFGRLKAWWHLRHREHRYFKVGCLWGNLEKRVLWLELMQRNFRTCGWICEQSSDWEDSDLKITGPGPVRATFCSTYEEILTSGEKQLRFRVRARPKLWAVALALVLAAGMVVSLTTAFTWPLVVPLALVLRWLVMSRRHMIRAVSHIAFECAQALDMPEAK